MKTTVDRLIEQSAVPLPAIIAKSGLAEERVMAIVAGRWLPTPAERIAISRALGVAVEDVDWGHTMSPRNVRYHRFGLPEDF